MIDHIPELIKAGVSSLKIEGRMKSVYYVAAVVAAYRKAIDSYYELGAAFSVRPEWREELERYPIVLTRRLSRSRTPTIPPRNI